MRISMLLAVAFFIVLSACSQSTATTSASVTANAPTSVATVATTVPATATATSTTRTHTALWVTVKYRSDPVDVADPRFVYIDGGSSSLVDAAFYDSGNGYMIISLNGIAYHYCGMPGRVWSAFRTASSLGSFYNAEIKGRFDCRSGTVPDY